MLLFVCAVAVGALGARAFFLAPPPRPVPKIDIEEFTNWFDGNGVGAEWTPPSNSEGWPPLEPGATRLHIKVRSSLAGGGDDHYSESGSVSSGASGSGSDGGSSSEEGSSSDSSTGSGSSTDTEGNDAVTTGAGEKGASTKLRDNMRKQKGPAVGRGGEGSGEGEEEGGKGKGKGGIFGSGAPWRRSKTAGAEAAEEAAAEVADNKSNAQTPKKRKRLKEKSRARHEQGGGGEEEGGGAKRRRHRRSANDDSGDEPPASPSASAHGSAAGSPVRGRRAFVSPGRLMLRGLRRAGSPAVDPWRMHRKTLGAVAEHEARTLLVRRARLRAQASASPFLSVSVLVSFVFCECGQGLDA